MKYDQFIELCKDSVFPAYLDALKNGYYGSFKEYIKNDNFEVAEGQNKYTSEVSANDEGSDTSLKARTTAKSGYHMKAGDILVCFGNNSSANFPGHAAIATSSKYVLEMPGTHNYSSKKNAKHHTKKLFFQHHANKNGYVMVYRINKRPNYASKAASYAYRKMFKTHNPSYFISTNLYHKSPSYCSKYVYLSYYWGATKSSLHFYKSNFHIVTPHGLVGNFKNSFKPTCIHKITKY